MQEKWANLYDHRKSVPSNLYKSLQQWPEIITQIVNLEPNAA